MIHSVPPEYIVKPDISCANSKHHFNSGKLCNTLSSDFGKLNKTDSSILNSCQLPLKMFLKSLEKSKTAMSEADEGILTSREGVNIRSRYGSTHSAQISHSQSPRLSP